MRFEDVRFLSSVGIIFTYAILIQFIAVLSVHGLFFKSLTIIITCFLYIWFSLFIQWVSRARRATFNEHNLLLTYQTRVYTHGHLFVPDPPTPCRIQTQSETIVSSEFRNARDAHYKDEFHHAINMSAERKMIPREKTETMRIEFDQSSSPPSSPNKSDKSPSFQI